MRHRSVKSLAHHEVGHRLHAWLGRIEDVDRLASLNARLEEAAPSIQDLVSDYLPAEMQHKAAFTHDAEIGRLTYTAWPPAAMDGPPATAAPPIAAVTKPVELRALLARSPRSLLWRLANQGLFARLAEELFVMVLADWPEGDLSLSNVKDAGGEGGQIELWLPPAAMEPQGGGASGESTPIAEAVEPIWGGLLTGQCTFRVVTQGVDGSELGLARFTCCIVVDLDRGQHCQHVVSCAVCPELTSSLELALGSPRLFSASLALGSRQQHLARPQKSGWLRKRGFWLPVMRERYFILHHGCLRYWATLPPFHPQEWREEELSRCTSNDVIQLAGATLLPPRAARTRDRRDEASQGGDGGGGDGGGCEGGGGGGGDGSGGGGSGGDGGGDDGGVDGGCGEGVDGGIDSHLHTGGAVLPREVEQEAGGLTSDVESLIIELITPCSRYPRYVLRASSASEREAWACAIAQHIWHGPHQTAHLAWPAQH